MRNATLGKIVALTVIVTTIIELYVALMGRWFLLIDLCLGAPVIGVALWFLFFRWKPWRSQRP
jgi:hypothetical protein